MRIIGVTGTNGKTTCVHLICSLLKDHFNCASFGTLGIQHYFEDKCVTTTTSLTTLAQQELQANLSKLINLGCEYIAMEVSSHGIVQNRIAGVEFTDLIFTNLSQDHLDYHHNMDNYFAAKLKLFTQVNAKLQRIIINLDDYYGIKLIKILQEKLDFLASSKVELIGFSVKPLAELECNHTIDLTGITMLTCENLRFTATGIYADLASSWGNANLYTKILGIHNLSNLLASIAATIPRLAWSQILPKIQALNLPKGRLHKVDLAEHYSSSKDLSFNRALAHAEVFVDYAHTPDGLAQVLLALKSHYINAKICCIFGCGGERDPSKRSEMLKVAEKHCEIVILTQDNPRNEDPVKIMQDILSHEITNKNLKLLVEMDRSKAINIAINAYYNDHVILIAGKGHEDKQVVREQAYPCCDYTIAKEALINLGAAIS